MNHVTCVTYTQITKFECESEICFTKCQNKHNNETHSLINEYENEYIILIKFQNKHTHSHIFIYIIKILQTIESFDQFLKK